MDANRNTFFLREVQEELLKKAREKAAEEFCLSLIEEGVSRELRDLAGDALEEEKAERDAKLHQLASLVMRKRTWRYFKRYSMSILSKTTSCAFAPEGRIVTIPGN